MTVIKISFLGIIPEFQIEEPSTPPQQNVNKSTKSNRVFRQIPDFILSTSSPRKKKLVKIIHQKEDLLRKFKGKCRLHADNISALSDLTESSLCENIFKGMPTATVNFMLSQIRAFKAKDVRGRRWTLDDKVLALAIYKRSPKCYRLLRSFVALPSVPTLLQILAQVPFGDGINPHIYQHLNENLKDINDRHCVLLFDEIDIKENLEYSRGEDLILGYESETSTDKKHANKALVFMLVGICKKWKQPICYYFSHNGVKSPLLKKYILEVLTAAKEIANLNVVATVCDMGSSNVKCMKDMGVTIHTPYFIFKQTKYRIIFDPPHLLKCTYSLFRKYNVATKTNFDGKEEIMEARFDDVRTIYCIDKNNPYKYRTLYKLKDYYFNPVLQQTMKVCVAAHTLSRTVAAFMYTLIQKGNNLKIQFFYILNKHFSIIEELEERAIGTVDFILEIDTLFDSLNASSKTAADGKDFKCILQEGSPHLDYWEKEIKNINNWNFIRKTKTGKFKNSKPPSQMGWLITINAVRDLWGELSQKGFASLTQRSLNQDPLENLFGCIRSGCGCSDNPNSKQFIGSLKTQVLNGLVKRVPGTNCENDNHVLLSDLKSFLSVDKNVSIVASSIQCKSDYKFDSISSSIADDVASGSIHSFSVAYVSGYIMKGILKAIPDCNSCKTDLSSSGSDLHNLYIENKEWSDTSKRLMYPSISLATCAGSIITEMEELLNKNSNVRGITNILCEALRSVIQFDWLTCEEHKDIVANALVMATIKIGIPWWCKRKNSEIQAIKKAKTESKKLKKMQHL